MGGCSSSLSQMRVHSLLFCVTMCAATSLCLIVYVMSTTIWTSYSLRMIADIYGSGHGDDEPTSSSMASSASLHRLGGEMSRSRAMHQLQCELDLSLHRRFGVDCCRAWFIAAPVC